MKVRNTRKNFFFILSVIISVILLSNIVHHLYLKYASAKIMIAPIEAYNFTDTAVVDIYVNNKWGGEAGARRGAGGGICCVLIPEKWRPGLVVNVKWKKTEMKNGMLPKLLSRCTLGPPICKSYS